MNARTGILTASSAVKEVAYSGELSLLQKLAMLTAVLLLLATAVSVVYVKDLNRRLLSEMQRQQVQTHALQVSWGQLKLEERTIAAPLRVQQVAKAELGMQTPTQRKVRMVRS